MECGLVATIIIVYICSCIYGASYAVCLVKNMAWLYATL